LLFAAVAGRMGSSAACGVKAKDPFTPETLELASLTLRRHGLRHPWVRQRDYFGGLSRPGPIAKSCVMTTEPPISPWKMTPARITLLALGVVAILMIAGAIFGGLGNYERLRESTDSSASSSASSSG
jgi:hypothetical protein